MSVEKALLGKTTRLYMVKKSKFGVYLSSGDYPELEVLLPNNQVPEGIEKGDILEVFLYKDSEDRLIATTEHPLVTLHETATLKVKDVTNIGAFLDWGLAKDLLLPFKEQIGRVKPGDTVLVALYLDKSDRLCATMHVYDYLSCDSSYQKNDHVRGRVYEISDSFGVFVAVDDKYSALLPRNELSQELKPGQEITARVKEVTKEGKLTLSLQEKVKVQMGVDAELLLKRLEAAGGFLPFHDKTSPEIIKREFKISKNAFKRAIGRLLKEKKIELVKNGIKMKTPDH
ncbi:MAG: S1 RNA-binding domain-containing protein [Lachnospiraceae bacterium]|nr:S1 RNA-binding domain-containing protein [Lachnospiraceae bacterium]